jgi:hypothetical protein
MGGAMLFMNKRRSENGIIERDSLNSYHLDDPYYEGDEDEVFDEIDCIQSTAEQSPSSDQQIVKKR